MSIRDAFNSELGQEVKRLREENEEVHAAVVRKQKELMEMRMDMVTEECPDCGTENTFKWSVLRIAAQKIHSNGAFLEVAIRRFVLNADSL